MSVALTDRQEMFCREFLIDLNATQAAIRCGYSPKTAHVQGSRMLSNVKVQGRIAELKNERSDRLEITADAVLRAYAEIAFSKGAGEFYEWKDGVLTPRKDVQPEALALIAEVQPGEHGYRIKVVDRMAALDRLRDHLGLNNENSSGGGPMEPPPAVTYHPVDARIRENPEPRSGKSER